MKPIVVIIGVCIFFSLGSCKKNNGSGAKDNSDPSNLIGTWELRKTSGGMMPGFKSYADGNGNQLKFKQGGAYEIYQNGILTLSGTYTIVSDPTIEASLCLVLPKDQYQNRVVFDGNNNRKSFFQIFNKNELVFYEGCYAVDAGHNEEYERK